MTSDNDDDDLSSMTNYVFVCYFWTTILKIATSGITGMFGSIYLLCVLLCQCCPA